MTTLNLKKNSSGSFELPEDAVLEAEATPSRFELPDGAILEQQEAPRERGRAILSGMTFGLGPRIMAAGRVLTLGEGWEEAKKKEFGALDEYRRSRPWEAAAFEAGGALPTMFIPGLGAIGNANRIRMAAGAANPAARAAIGVGSVGSEVARGGAQMGALHGALSSRDYTDVGDMAQNTAVGGAVGWGVGRVGHAVAQPAINAIRNLHEAAAVGSNARGAALRQLRQSVGEQGTDLAVARRSPFPAPRANMTEQGQEAAVMAYRDAINAGQTEAAAQTVARQAYAATNPTVRGNPLSASTIDDHTRGAVADYGRQNRVPLIAGELLSGPEAPMRGEMQALTQSLMKMGGEAATTLKNTTASRSERAIPRTRELVDQTIGAGLPGSGRNYIDAITDITNNARAANRVNYNLAEERARAFDILPALNAMDDLAFRRMAGQQHETVSAQTRAVRDWFDRQMSMRRPEDSFATRGSRLNRDFLESYKQMRAGLTNTIDTARINGDRTSAMYLEQLKREMDRIARRRNPFWGRANDNAADSFHIQDAATVGRNVPLKEGADTQLARHRLAGNSFANDRGFITVPERESFRIGYARRLQDELSGLGDDHGVAKLFRRGNDDNEGPRAMIGSVLNTARTDAASVARDAALARGTSASNQRQAAARARERIPTSETFFRDIEREHVAHSTNQLSNNSATSTVQAADRKRNALINAAAALKNNPNPIDWLAQATRMIAERMGRERDAQLAEMLARTTDDPRALIQLFEELQRTAPGMRQGFYDEANRGLANALPSIAMSASAQNNKPPAPKQRVLKNNIYTIGAGR